MDKNKRAHALHQFLEQSLTCPINRTIMLDPVVAEDGIVYEKQAIEKWFKTKNISPTNGQPIRTNLVPAYLVKNIIDEFLKYNPKLKDQQHILEKMDHLDHICAVGILLLKKNKYDDMLFYQNFSLAMLFTQYDFRTFLENASFEILKYVVDNTTELNTYGENKEQLIHYAARLGRSDLVIYLINKNVSLEEKNKNGIEPIHLIFRNCNLDAIKCIMDKKLSLDKPTIRLNRPIHFLLKNKKLSDSEIVTILEKISDFFLECDTINKNRPIHLACEMRGRIVIEYLVIKRGVKLDCQNSDNNYPIYYLLNNAIINGSDKMALLENFTDLECLNEKGRRPIHAACNTNDNTNDEIIRYLVNRGVDLNVPDADKWNPIHYLCYEETNIQMILYFLEKKVELNCKTSKGERPIHFLARKSCLTIMKLLMEHGAEVDDLQ